MEDIIDAARYNELEELQEILASPHARQLINAQDERGSTALHMAAANGNIECMKRLLEAGASVDVCNGEQNSPLHFACLLGHAEAVRLLMEHKAEPSKLNAFERTPVDDALDAGHRECVDIIKSFAQGAEDDEVDDVEVEGEEVEEVPAAEGEAGDDGK